MLTGRRYRLELTAEQTDYAERVGGACRSVWNTGLEQRRVYRQRGTWINYHEQARQLAEAKIEHPWLAEAPSHTLQQTLIDLDRACRAHGTVKVRWRSGRRWTPSFRFPEGGKIAVERLGRRNGRVRLPKFGWVQFRWSRPIGGGIRSATVARDGKHWYVSFLVENGGATPVTHAEPGTAVGIDRGVNTPLALSDGRLWGRRFVTRGEEGRLLALQRRMSRQQRRRKSRRGPQSKRYQKTRAAYGRLYKTVRDRRADWQQWTANRICAQHHLAGIEKLHTKNMTASARGTTEQPGRNVRQKAGLNRAILDKGWHGFALALHNQARKTGTVVVEVPAPYTSQRCWPCGHTTSENRDSQAVFRCVACGHTAHADVNAAGNVQDAAVAVSGFNRRAAGARTHKPRKRRVNHPPAQHSLVGIPRLLALAMGRKSILTVALWPGVELLGCRDAWST